MPYVTTKDGVDIYYKDWGSGRPVVFSHGWPLSADAWDSQMLFLQQHGLRVVAHDRRGHGRSDQPGHGNDMDTYADDLACVVDALDLHDAVLVGHSTGGGEVARYIGRHGTARVAKAVLVGSVTPIMVSTPQWPHGVPVAAMDEIRKSVADNRSDFYMDLAKKVLGTNRLLTADKDGLQHAFWRQGMLGSLLGQYLCVHEFSEVDYTEDLKKMTIPTLVVHGDDDQIVPIGHSAELTVKIVPQAELLVYKGAPHGVPLTHQDRFNADLLAFATR